MEVNDNGVLFDKAICLSLVNSIEKSNIYLEYLNNKIKFYERQVCLLNENMPSRFQRKLLRENVMKQDEYNNKIKQLYKEIEDEYKLVFELYNSIK